MLYIYITLIFATTISSIYLVISQGYVNSLQDNTTETINKKLTFLREILASAYEDDLIAKNPADSRRINLGGKESTGIKALPRETVKELIKKIQIAISCLEDRFSPMNRRAFRNVIFAKIIVICFHPFRQANTKSLRPLVKGCEEYLWGADGSANAEGLQGPRAFVEAVGCPKVSPHQKVKSASDFI